MEVQVQAVTYGGLANTASLPVGYFFGLALYLNESLTIHPPNFSNVLYIMDIFFEVFSKI